MIAEFIFKWVGIIGIIVTVIGIIMFQLSLKNTEHDGRWKFTLAIGISLIIVSLIGKHFIILNILKWVLNWVGIIGIIVTVISIIRFLLSLKSAEHE